VFDRGGFPLDLLGREVPGPRPVESVATPSGVRL
jgi:hypothetical protein